MALRLRRSELVFAPAQQEIGLARHMRKAYRASKKDARGATGS